LESNKKIMRIISGRYRNKKIFFPKNLRTRPLKDSVRENIFNILKHSKNIQVKIENSYIMDLYAGSGSFGIECLSRDAEKVYFVEKDKEAINNLKKNIRNLNLENKSEIFDEDILEFSRRIQLKKKIDIIFLDPPYKNEEYINTIKVLRDKDVLNKKHIVIMHRERKTNFELNKKINIIENRIYGRSEIFFGILL
tara:strand:- start:4118 stop:4702 length:585 start_codon:yes stop_codon:yes gene_type:complete